MNDENLGEISALLNDWWKSEELPEEMAYARFLVIFKKRRHNIS